MTFVFRLFKLFLQIVVFLMCPFFGALSLASDPKDGGLIDAHIHYSHDVWDVTPPTKAIALLKEAGLRKAFVSSSSDQGTQMLYALDPELIVPVLRPYRKRGELGSWMYDETVPDMLSHLLEKNDYAGIGEFHAFGDDMELPVLWAHSGFENPTEIDRRLKKHPNLWSDFAFRFEHEIFGPVTEDWRRYS